MSGSPVFTVLADFSGTAKGAAPSWTDITAYVLIGQGGTPIKVTWGTSDEESDPQPRQCTLTLDNNDGRFTPDSSAPVYTNVDTDVRIRVYMTVAATQYYRFDGYVTDWDAGYDGAGPMAVVDVTATDITAWMGEATPLRSLVLEEMLLDTPTALYPLDEAAGTSSAGDVTAQQPAAVVTNSKYGVGTLTFGAETTLLGAAGGVAMSSPDSGTTTTAARASYLSVPNALPASGAFSLELWFQGPTAHPAAGGLYLLMCPAAAGAAGGPGEIFAFIKTDGQVAWGLRGNPLSSILNGTTSVDVCDGKWHQLVITVDASGTSATLYIDGVSQVVATAGSDILWSNPGLPISLGVATNYNTTSLPLNGAVALHAQYDTALTGGRVAAHYTAGATAFAGEGTGARVSRLLSYRPNTGSVIDTGSGTIGVQDTAGVTLAAALLDVATAEGGYLYVDGQGRVVFLQRSHLYDPTASLTLDSSQDQVDASLRFRKDTQNVVNDVTYSRPAGAAQRVTDATSVAKYGPRTKNDTLLVNSDRDALDAAGWRVANGKTSKTRTPEVDVDLLSEPSNTQLAAVLNAAPWTVAQITNLPAATAPTTTLQQLVEGGQETIDIGAWDIGFYTAPLPRRTLRADATASTYTKLDSGLAIAW